MKKNKGFTLIELMIVIAIIAIIAAIAIPGLLRARISGNEGSAIGTMRTISTNQAQFQGACNVDTDADEAGNQTGDGIGEFGLLNELTGATPCRDDGAGKVCDPAYLTSSLTTNANIYGTKSGYCYTMYLPGTGAAVTDVPTATGQAPITAATDSNMNENKWRCYATPASKGSSGNRVFAIDLGNETYAYANNATLLYGVAGDGSDNATFDAFTLDNPTPDSDTTFPTVFKANTNWKPAS